MVKITVTKLKAGILRGLYWGYIGIMEHSMETTILGYIEFRVHGLGFRAL